MTPLFYSVRTFARIRQNIGGTDAWAVPLPQIVLGDRPPSPPLGLRPRSPPMVSVHFEQWSFYVLFLLSINRTF